MAEPARTSRPSSPSRPSIADRLKTGGAIARGTVLPAVAAFRDPARLTARLWLAALRSDRRARFSTAVLAGFVIVAIVGSFSPPLVGRAQETLLGPSPVHPFGTDVAGRDVLMILVEGTTGTLMGGIGAALAAALVGIALGVLGGFMRGTIDAFVHRLTEAVHAIPALFFVLILQAIAPAPGPTTVLLAIVATRWTEFARVVRADVLRVLEADHVTAARALGASPSRILARHVLPAVISSALVLVAFSIGAVVIVEAAVAVVGVGRVDPLSWGALLAESRPNPRAWWLVVFPALLIAIVVSAASLLGEAMRDALDPRLRGVGVKEKA